jgi:hypothetical protein
MFVRIGKYNAGIWCTFYILCMYIGTLPESPLKGKTSKIPSTVRRPTDMDLPQATWLGPAPSFKKR